jgi:hypothetical protein
MRDLETEALRVAIYRRMTGEQRLAIAMRMFDQGVATVRANILAQWPEIGAEELQDRVRERVLGREIAEQVRAERARRRAQAHKEGA